MKNKELFEQMFEEVRNAHYILIVTNGSSDIDSIASSLSLSNYFFNNRIKHKVFNDSNALPKKINFLSKFDKITSTIPQFYDLIIYMSSADKDTMIKSLNTEANTIYFSDSNCSKSEFLYEFYQFNDIKISEKIAECLYVGIYDYTSAFTNFKTNKNTFETVSNLMNSNIKVSNISNHLRSRESLAKFNANSKIMTTLDLFCEGKVATVHLDDKWINETGISIDECDDIVDVVLRIGIVQVVAYFKVVNDMIEVILKSKDNLDISFINSSYKGVGNKYNSIVILSSSSFVSSKERVVNSILNYI